MIRKGLLGLAALVALLVFVLLVKTFTYGGNAQTGTQAALPEPPAIDADRAATRLGEAITFQTITLVAGDPLPGRQQPWIDFQRFLSATYRSFYAAAEVETVPGTLTLLHTWQGSENSLKPILFMAHQDVVPVNLGTANDWTHGAFDGVVADGFIYGRGAMDNKNGVIALFEAMDALARDGFAPRRTLHILLGHDEEVSGSGAEAGIALLKARGTTPEFALDEGLLIVESSPLTGEPTGYIGVAEKGYLSLQITVEADGGHSSTPPRDSAAVRLARILVALDETQMPSHRGKAPSADLFEASAGDMGFFRRLVFANQWLFGGLIDSQLSGLPQANAVIRTTTAPTMMVGSDKENVLPQRASAIVNFRVHPQDTTKDVIDHVEAIANRFEGAGVEMLSGSGITAAEASPISPVDTDGYRAISAAASGLQPGVSVVPALVLGATDSRYAYAVTPNVYRFAPMIASSAEIDGIHGTDEKIAVENLQRMAQSYAQIVLLMDELE